MSIHTFTIYVPRRRRETIKTATTEGYRWVEDGEDKVEIEVVVDVAEIGRRLGAKAWKSKGKRAKGLNGLVIVTAKSGKQVGK